MQDKNLITDWLIFLWVKNLQMVLLEMVTMFWMLVIVTLLKLINLPIYLIEKSIFKNI